VKRAALAVVVWCGTASLVAFALAVGACIELRDAWRRL
jgi:hypothetical protein